MEFNWTFHERERSTDQFKRAAAEVHGLRLQAVLKVSGVATHENRLQRPEQWWPDLWAKYREFESLGVLGGLLWQLAPSFHCSAQALADLERVAQILPREVLHIFEFRHSSWYGRSSVLDVMRKYGLCLAWLHITNEDGWCGDLPSGWPSQARTCASAYMRLFGTKQKAVGRYSLEFLRDEVLPYIRGDHSLKEAIVVFAQADAPQHAIADASALVELLGRRAAVASDLGRGTRWEREVLAATLGLEEGSVVDGVVQRVSHRTVFLDIGRSCRGTVCVNHARRVGLLDSLRVGVSVEGLVVQHLDFQGEMGIVGLTCHSAHVGLGAADAVSASAVTASSSKKSRWSKDVAVGRAASKVAGDDETRSIVALGTGEGQRFSRWSAKRDAEPQIAASGQDPKVQLIPRGGAVRRSRSEGPLARTKREAALLTPPPASQNGRRHILEAQERAAILRAEAKKAQGGCEIRLAPREGIGVELAVAVAAPPATEIAMSAPPLVDKHGRNKIATICASASQQAVAREQSDIVADTLTGAKILEPAGQDVDDLLGWRRGRLTARSTAATAMPAAAAPQFPSAAAAAEEGVGLPEPQRLGSTAGRSSTDHAGDAQSSTRSALQAWHLAPEVLNRETTGQFYVAFCDCCAATRLVTFDFIGMGLDFSCGCIGLPCQSASIGGVVHQAWENPTTQWQ